MRSLASWSSRLPSPLRSTTFSAPVRSTCRLAFLDDLAAGRFTVANLEPDDYGVVAGLERRYDNLGVGLADLGVIIVAKRYGTRCLLTFDERHFRALRPLDGGQFTVLPSDPADS